MEGHLLACAECRELLEQAQFFLRMSIKFPNIDGPGLSRDCLSEQDWRSVAIGMWPARETQDHIDHALDCPRCAALLQRAAEEFADEPAEDETRILSRLKSAEANWQAELGRMMSRQSSSAASRQTANASTRRWNRPVALATAMAAALIVSLPLWWFTYSRSGNNVDRLLSRAYTEQRTMEMRLAGADYAPVEAFRGGESSEFHRPTSLLEAEVIIAKQLASNPDEPFWLDAQARADLMNDDYASAIPVLERAHRYAPEDREVGINLASAFFLRAEILKRSEDYGQTVELLGQVLSKDSRNEVALFNRAVALERLHLYGQAAVDWRHYLELDPISPWAAEARKRAAGVEEKIRLQNNQSEKPLLGPVGFQVLLETNPQNAAAELDQRFEQYFAIALSDWISLSYAQGPTEQVEPSRRALQALAKVMLSKHGDHWLADFLGETSHGPAGLRAINALAEAVRTSQTADLDHVHKAAIDAATAFRQSGNRAGELMARFQASYADQLAHQLASCLSETRVRGDPLVVERYPWLRTQFALESSVCTGLTDESARQLASDALEVARTHNYGSLELRATNFLTELYQYLGDTSTAWRYSADGLVRYWAGDYPRMRGYSLYIGLDTVAEERQQWYLDAQILGEASRFIAGDPDFELRAIERHRLANAQAMTGDFQSARASLEEARLLFLRSASGLRKDNFELEAQIGLAKLDLFRSQPAAAVERLEPLAGRVKHLSDEDLVFEYSSVLGLAYFALGSSAPAHECLLNALRLVEDSLRKNSDERDRLTWCRRADRVYRALVALDLARPAEETFGEWEWFKGASLRDAPRSREDLLASGHLSSPSVLLPPNTIVVSYAALPQGILAWTYSGTGTRLYRLTVSAPEIEELAHRFADHCARPDSDLRTLHRESRALYEKLIAPLEPFLSSYQHLVIEPDQGLWFIPFEALQDKQGTYLADRYAISFSPGLDYLTNATPWHGISGQNPILLAADPGMVGKKPLDDAKEEAKGIAHQFRYAQLLLEEDADYRRIAEGVRKAEVFHFSGHAAASPDGVGLMLGDSDVLDAAAIRVSDFSGLRLAVLSACVSANGSTGVFDDRDSLARLLVGAGVPEVVASRWVVNSRATARLMEEFYTQLLSGKDVSLALSNASRKLREQAEFRHPFYWASFSAFGKS
jgi:CHAT domain-containing protein